MKFAEFVSEKAIKSDLSAEDKEGVIREIIQALVDAEKIAEEDVESIFKAVMKREELGSTGIGRGIAVPHTKHPSVSNLVGAVAVSEEGIGFNSLDGENVQVFFMLISPPDQPGDHLRALENISRQLRDETFCMFLKQCRTNEDIWQILEEADNNQFVS